MTHDDKLIYSIIKYINDNDFLKSKFIKKCHLYFKKWYII